MPASTTDGFLTVQEAARLLKVSTVTIKRWLKQGRLRAYHVGPRAIRIKQEDIEGMITPTTATTGTAIYEETPTPSPHTLEPHHPQPPSAAELARRQQLVATIHARRQARVIAPLTATQLIQIAREEEAEHGKESGYGER